ncbi:MAG TPA: hypothetical protein VEJ16_03265 [Alphaproteobacteria bacterium]|nr:hypothetical protein [Alphaproteobacteria bacterium]
MTNIARRFIIIAVIYAIIGMAHGIEMGISGDHSEFTMHAHINLVGWASLALYGLTYRAFPAMAVGWLAVAHFWLANLGALLMAIGLYLLFTNQIEVVLIVGSLLTFFAAVVFLVNFVTRSEKPA